MHIPSAKAMRRLAAALCLAAMLLSLYAAMAMIAGVNPCAYDYNSYLLQAQSWLQGRAHLARDYSHLELAVYDGRYYVSFPPVPSIPMALLTLMMGDNVPGGLIQKIYIAIACIAVFYEIARSKKMNMGQCIAWTAGICICSAMLPIGLVGGVWYEAQILAFLFSVCAISALRRDHPTAACLCYALAVGCRPFSALLGPVLLAMYLGRGGYPGRKLRRLMPGIAVGLIIAAAYGAYNYARFGNVFEFGHNHLPEFTRSEHGQFSLAYAAQNWKQLLFGLPLRFSDGKIKFYEFGFSMFLSCPILICGALWWLQDLIRRRMNPVKWMCTLMGAANVLLLAMHRTLGGHQFGLRYALELVPLCLCWYLQDDGRREMKKWEFALLGFGLIFNFIGGCLVHI